MGDALRAEIKQNIKQNLARFITGTKTRTKNSGSALISLFDF